MRRFALITATCLALAPAAQAEEEDNAFREGMSLLSEGTRLLLEGLVDELEPALRGVDDLIDDLNTYHAPEMLPNGDIIIRRRTPLTPEEPAPGEIEI